MSLGGPSSKQSASAACFEPPAAMPDDNRTFDQKAAGRTAEDRLVGNDVFADGAAGRARHGAIDFGGALHRHRHELDLMLHRRCVRRR